MIKDNIKHIFNGSLFTNIDLISPFLKKSEIKKSAEKVLIFISSFPRDLDVRVSLAQKLA